LKNHHSIANRSTPPGTGRTTPDGPRICIHDAPIEAICLDCEREICERWEKDPLGASVSSMRVLQALERRAEGLGEFLSVQLTLESFIIEDIRIIRFVRVTCHAETDHAPHRRFTYHVTDGWGSTQLSDQDGVLGRIADTRRRARVASGLASSAQPREGKMKPEPLENLHKCQSGIPHGPGQCPDCPS